MAQYSWEEGEEVRAFAECPGCGGFFSPWEQAQIGVQPLALTCPSCGLTFVPEPLAPDSERLTEDEVMAQIGLLSRDIGEAFTERVPRDAALTPDARCPDPREISVATMVRLQRALVGFSSDARADSTREVVRDGRPYQP
jgi:hypothetical protein